MNNQNITEFVESTGLTIPPVEQFWKLGDLTGLRQDKSGRFYRANYERGILLYVLVATHKPKTVLEFGTGRGYGAICMAWAMEDFGIPGKIFTIDMLPEEEEFEWAVDWGEGPTVEHLSRSQVWPQAAPGTWLDRIEPLTGRTSNVMKRWNGPKIEMGFIDGGHDFDSVRHDFYTLLDVSADRFGVLFDDYAPRPGFGVQQLIDDEVAPHFETNLIYTDRRWDGGERRQLEDPDYGMIWIDSATLQSSLTDAYPVDERNRAISSYRQKQVWAALRRAGGRFVRRILKSK